LYKTKVIEEYFQELLKNITKIEKFETLIQLQDLNKILNQISESTLDEIDVRQLIYEVNKRILSSDEY